MTMKTIHEDRLDKVLDEPNFQKMKRFKFNANNEVIVPSEQQTLRMWRIGRSSLPSKKANNNGFKV